MNIRTARSVVAFAVVTLQTVGVAEANDARVELLTVGAGDTLETRFGHAVLCVFSDRYPRGECFNYGATRAREGLATSIVLGNAEFLLKRDSYSVMWKHYVTQDRTIYRQVLSLDAPAANRVIARLEHDSLPDNRAYLYRPIADNCSTRVRDVLDNATAGALRRYSDSSAPHLTYRGFLRDALHDEPVLLAALDLALGATGDEPLDGWNSMFAPPVLRTVVADALDAPPAIIYEGASRSHSVSAWTGRTGVLVAAGIVLLLAAAGTYRGGWTRTATLVLLGAAATAISVFPWAVIAVSDLPERWPNYAVAVLVPTDVMLSVCSLAATDRRLAPAFWLQRYGVIRLVLLVGVAGATLLGTTQQPLLPWIVLAAAPWAGLTLGLRMSKRPWRTGRATDDSATTATVVPRGRCGHSRRTKKLRRRRARCQPSPK